LTDPNPQAPAALPIDAALPELLAALHTQPNAVLIAPPGAGKTTATPLALLTAPWRQGGRILLLEPRRLAARLSAQRMAALLREPLGQTVGLTTRLERKVSACTQIEVVTEGILTRRLQRDPELPGVAAVLFDEFHERSLQAELGLALALEVQATLRPELRLLVMSATLEAEPVAALLGQATVVHAQGRMFPVTLRYQPPRADESLPQQLLRAARAVLAESEGHVLVFLPGMAEIRAAERLLAAELPATIALRPLHGALPAAAQQAALDPEADGRRKLILATSVAQTSLTIEGVRVVIDAGLARTGRFDPRTGLTRMLTRPVSRAAAEQRTGRAGRQAPGLCLRLMSSERFAQLPAADPPELEEADLSPLVLEAALWGSPPERLSWLDPPPAAALAAARAELAALGALNDPTPATAGGTGSLTPHGRELAELGLHPRLGHLLLKAGTLAGRKGLPPGSAESVTATACWLAAWLEEGLDDGSERNLADSLRQALQRRDGGSRRLEQAARRLTGRVGVPADPADPAWLPPLILLAYPERLAQRRGPVSGIPPQQGWLLASGRGAALPANDPLNRHEWLAVATLDDRDREARIRTALPLSLEAVEAVLEATVGLGFSELARWDAEARAVRPRRRRSHGALVLREHDWPNPPPEHLAEGLCAGIRALGLAALPWSERAEMLHARLAHMRLLEGETWPEVAEAALLATLEQWLRPRLQGQRRLDEIKPGTLSEALLGLLDWNQRERLDRLLPERYPLGNGRSATIDYRDEHGPLLAARVQDFFGLNRHPSVAEGRLPLRCALLSPAGRPAALTSDLPGFWKGGYFDLRRELRGRYPKHPWPEDPTQPLPPRRG